MIRRIIANVPRYLACAALPLALACSEPPEPKTPLPVPYVAPPRLAAAPVPAPPAEATPVVLDPTIAATCGIPQPKSYFAFDSSLLRHGDASGLSGVARCFRDGPLKGRSMDVTGRADPRGSDAYNQTLGQSRAGAVSQYLTSSGVRKETISALSTGKDSAKGTDEAGWAEDRRVDIKLSD